MHADLLDIGPTVLELLGVTPPGAMRGRSLVSLGLTTADLHSSSAEEH